MNEYEIAVEHVRDCIGYTDTTDAVLALNAMLEYPRLRELLAEAGLIMDRAAFQPAGTTELNPLYEFVETPETIA